MRAKLIVEGKEFDIDIFNPELQKFIKSEKKTGYERVGEGHTYSFVNAYGEIKTLDHEGSDDDLCYDEANYYSDRTVAENNARADKLMRQLRRFAVKHREKISPWNETKYGKRNYHYYLFYHWGTNSVETYCNDEYQTFGCIYFNSKATAEEAIKTFNDELIWYFTEYKDSL